VPPAAGLAEDARATYWMVPSVPMVQGDVWIYTGDLTSPARSSSSSGTAARRLAGARMTGETAWACVSIGSGTSDHAARATAGSHIANAARSAPSTIISRPALTASISSEART